MVLRGPDHWFMPIQDRPTDAKAIVGARLRVLRAALGYQQQDIAAFLNLTPQALSGWETGKDLADPLAVARMARRFGFSTDWIWLGVLAGTPRELADAIERRRPDLVHGAAEDAQPAPGWDRLDSGARRQL